MHCTIVLVKCDSSRRKTDPCKSKIYERDIICLPKSFEIEGCIKIPRGLSQKEFLAQNVVRQDNTVFKYDRG